MLGGIFGGGFFVSVLFLLLLVFSFLWRIGIYMDILHFDGLLSEHRYLGGLWVESRTGGSNMGFGLV